VRRSFAILSLFVAAAAPLAAQSFTTGASGVGTQDASWSVSWATGPYDTTPGTSGGSFSPWVVSPVGGVWQPGDANTNWISAWPSASAADGVGDYNETNDAGHRYTYTFRYDFNALSAGALDFTAGWDNIFSSFVLNGVSYDPTSLLTSVTDNGVDDHFGFCRSGDGVFDSSDYPNCTANFAVNGVVAGSNYLEVILLGDGTTDGLWMDGSVDNTGLPQEATPEPATMTLIATGLVGMAGASLRRRRKIVA
jgi:hypothetical protein